MMMTPKKKREIPNKLSTDTELTPSSLISDFGAEIEIGEYRNVWKTGQIVVTHG